MIPFPFNENRFSFFFFFVVADHLLVGQLCTNPRAIGALLSCLKSDTIFNEQDRRYAAVQLMLSTVPSYDNRTITSTLKMQILIATNNRDVPRVMKIKFPATVMVFGVVSSEGHPMPPYIFEVRLESLHQSVPECAEECGDPTGATMWPVADLGCGSRTRRRPTSPKWPRRGFRSATTLYPSLTEPPSSPDLNPLDYFVWSYVENITNMTSHNIKASLIAAIRQVFAELPPALWKRHASVPDPYQGGDWGWRRLHWIDVSSTT